MPLVLHIDQVAWHRQIGALASARPGLIPVAKGNGYGFGNRRLAQVAQAHGFTHLAVCTTTEAKQVADVFSGQIVVLTPLDPRTPDPPVEPPELAERTIRTVSSLVAAQHLPPGGRIAVELASPLRRYGLTPDQYAAAARQIDRPIDALTLHLPLATSRFDEVAQAVFAAQRAGLQTDELHVSHMPASAVEKLTAETGLLVRPRIGSELWLGAGTAISATGTVRAVHPVHRGDRVGYRRRRVPGTGQIVVVDGGTSHGVGLIAAPAGAGPRRRMRNLARAAAASLTGIVYSPYTLDGRRLRFADTPHAQTSMVWVPDGLRPPAVGEELPLRVRHTITQADDIVEL
ncbi:MAG: alanine racemase [Bifidobacteriaceae bacterium]|jgi:alanine racemase|nr:alanine racemase [Bifidobacteriaceae bacterium]